MTVKSPEKSTEEGSHASILPLKPGLPLKPNLYFTPDAIEFLRLLARNNRRDWFEPRKSRFEQELKEPMLAMISAVTDAMRSFAPGHVRPAQKCMMRIYRDTRFSSDKRPLKDRVAAWWSHAGLPRTSGAGYYFHLSAQEVVLAAGVYMPDRQQLLAIRTFLLEHHGEVRALLQDKKLRRLMLPFEDDSALRRAPRGFSRDHPAIDLIACKRWGVHRTMPAEEALSPGFLRKVILHFRAAAPLVEALNQPLLQTEKQNLKYAPKERARR